MPTEPADTIIYANRFCVEAHDEGRVLYFGYHSRWDNDSPVFAMELSALDLERSKDSLMVYLGDVGEEIPEIPKWIPPSLDKILSANVMQLARTGRTAETTFVAVSTHTVIEVGKKKGSGKSGDEVALIGAPILSVRSSLTLQVAMINALYSHVVN